MMPRKPSERASDEIHSLADAKEEVSPIVSCLHENFLEEAEEYAVEGYEVDVPEEAKGFCQMFADLGGRALLVGGSVRDTVINREFEGEYELESKDWDFEVYGIEASDLHRVLIEQFGEGNVKLEGEHFKQYKIRVPWSKQLIDVSLPRTDSKTGEGYLGFEITGDPGMSIKEAAARRDITINTFAYDVLTDTLYDPYNGIDAVLNKEIAVTDEAAFVEDPLRVLRIMQFISRFEFEATERTKELCAQLVAEDEVKPIPPRTKETKHKPGTGEKGVSSDRITTEFVKLMTRGRKPSLGLEFAREIGFVEKYWPEMHALIGVEQEADLGWHEEGDAWAHTLQSVDAMALIIKREFASGRLPPQCEIDTVRDAYKTKLAVAKKRGQLTPEMRDDLLREYFVDYASMVERVKCSLMLGALCHDFGKPETTVYSEKDAVWAWRTPGHSNKGIRPSQDFMERLHSLPDVDVAVSLFVKFHMDPKGFWRDEQRVLERRTKLTAEIKWLIERLAMEGEGSETRIQLEERLTAAQKAFQKLESVDVSRVFVKRARQFAGTGGNLYMLMLIAESDQRGRRPQEQGTHPLAEDEVDELSEWKAWYEEKIATLHVTEQGVDYLIKGKVLKEAFPEKPGPWIGVLLECFLMDQADEIITADSTKDAWFPMASRYKEAADAWVSEAITSGRVREVIIQRLEADFERIVTMNATNLVTSYELTGRHISWEDAYAQAGLDWRKHIDRVGPNLTERDLTHQAWGLLTEAIREADDARTVLFSGS